MYTDRDLARLPPRPVPAVPLPGAAREGATLNDAPEGRDGGAAGEWAERAGIGAAQDEAPKAREKRDEQHWRERAELIRGRLDRVRADVNALAARVAEIQTPRNSGPDLQQATADLARFQQKLQYIEREWATFEQRAQQAKVPTSWLR